MKRKVAAVIILALAAAIAAGCLMFVGPEMEHQQHIRAYQAVMPPTPEGSVPLKDPLTSMPTTREADELVRVAAGGAEAADRGKVYYDYYCVFCHGDAGDGLGPVGESYTPQPADLRSAKVRALSDGQLLRAMLLGTGHEPVLQRVVPPQSRPFIVLYVRKLQANAVVTAAK